MTIDFKGLKANARKFCWQITQSQHIVGRAHRLEAVLINNQHQVFEPVMGRHQGTLPDRPFIQLTVANDGVHLLIRSLSLQPKGDANAH